MSKHIWRDPAAGPTPENDIKRAVEEKDEILQDATREQRLDFYESTIKDLIEELNDQQIEALRATEEELEEPDQPTVAEVLLEEAIRASAFSGRFELSSMQNGHLTH